MPGASFAPHTSGRRVEYQRFPTRYFSKCDVDIYFKDIYIDEITSLEFQLQENTQPIYGYASYIPDTFVKGNRMVTGTFRINFRSPYYLHYIINEIEYRKREGDPFEQETPHEREPSATGAEQLLEQSRSITGNQKFKQLANQYQKAIWGETIDEPFKALMENREIDSFFTPRNRRPKVHAEGFDIIIKYGDTPMPPNEVEYPSNTDYSKVVKSINGVQITGVSQVVDERGRPIEEEYTFLAKDLDSTITTYQD